MYKIYPRGLLSRHYGMTSLPQSECFRCMCVCLFFVYFKNMFQLDMVGLLLVVWLERLRLRPLFELCITTSIRAIMHFK